MKRFWTVLFVITSPVLFSGATLFAQSYQDYAELDPYSGTTEPPSTKPPKTTKFYRPLPKVSSKDAYDLAPPSYEAQSEIQYRSQYEYHEEDSGYESIGGERGGGELSLYYAYRDFSDFGAASGFGAALKINLMELIYLRATYDRVLSEDAKVSRVDANSFGISAGMEMPVYQALFLFGDVGVRYDALKKATPEWDSGLQLVGRIGLRWEVTEKLEFSAVISAETTEFNAYKLELSGFYSILPMVDLGAGLDLGEDFRSYKLGGRVKW